ncbi:MAG: rod shape-determining protein RodA [Candidatus Binatia bacterium]|nr:MAG: rod shape-determining protein RodA [Candidatus Binatia bacterium]
MLRFDRRLLDHIDWGVASLVLLLCALGWATVLSATYEEAHPLSVFAKRQAVWMALGVAVLVAVQLFDYRWLERYAYLFYALGTASLEAVRHVGSTGGGSQRWLSLGGLSIQPSEFAKLFLVVALARYLQLRLDERGLSFRTVLGAVALVAPPALLTLVQPDLGTALLLVLVGSSVLVFAGVQLRWLFATVLLAGPLLPIVWNFLKPYQRARILVFLDPHKDPLGTGYHMIQSQIAIGSGQWFGRGYLHGPQNHLDFLPEQHTDFVFSVFAEEWGFLGSVVLLALYAALIGRCLVVAYRAKDVFGMLLAAGFASLFFWHVTVNVAMASGLLPVVGMTLPFFSYGGSSLVTMMAAAGLVMNVSMRRFTF